MQSAKSLNQTIDLSELLETEATEDFQTFSNDDEEVSINPNEDAIPQNSKQADNMVSQQELEGMFVRVMSLED